MIGTFNMPNLKRESINEHELTPAVARRPIKNEFTLSLARRSGKQRNENGRLRHSR